MYDRILDDSYIVKLRFVLHLATWIGYLFDPINTTMITNWDTILEMPFIDEKIWGSKIEHKHVLVYFSLKIMWVSPLGAAKKHWCDTGYCTTIFAEQVILSGSQLLWVLIFRSLQRNKKEKKVRLCYRNMKEKQLFFSRNILDNTKNVNVWVSC